MTTRPGLIGLLAATLWFTGCGSGGESNEVVIGRCTSDQPLCQKFGGHSWSNMKDDLTFDAAKEYCSSLGARLPTISELRALIVECDTTEPGGECRVTDTCTSNATCCEHMPCVGCGDGGHSVFGEDNRAWSSTPVADQPGYVWNVTFRYSEIGPIESDYPISAYCLKP
jgi:hypothetical protein